MSDATQSPSLEQTMNRTDFGHFLFENRKAFFGALLASVITIIAFLGWKQAQEASALENSVKVFEFQKSTWEEAKNGKINAQDLVSKFDSLSKDVQTAPVMIPMALEMGKFLFEKGNFNEAEGILSKVSDQSTGLGNFFVGMQRYVVLEKLGKVDEAIVILENILKKDEAVMKALVAVELGRLYLSKDEKGKAQTQFDYVISTFPNDEHAKLAKLYLAQMAK